MVQSVHVNLNNKLIRRFVRRSQNNFSHAHEINKIIHCTLCAWNGMLCRKFKYGAEYRRGCGNCNSRAVRRLVNTWRGLFCVVSRVELAVIVALPVGSGCGAPLGLIECVRALILLAHAVHYEHHHQDGAEKPYHCTADHSWNFIIF